MKLLVITPTLGQSPWLAETVASVAAQNVGCLHALVAPRNAVASLEARFPSTIVVAEPAPHLGMYAAINAGAAAVPDWDAFTYINDDDRLLRPMIGCVAAAARQSSPTVAYGRVRLVDAGGYRRGEVPICPWPRLLKALYQQGIEAVYQHGTVINRAAWTAVGPFDASLSLCGDSEWLARACFSEVRFVYAGGIVADFRLREGQMSRRVDAMAVERALVHGRWATAGSRTSKRWARFCFRMANLGAYAERICRDGLVSMQTVQRR